MHHLKGVTDPEKILKAALVKETQAHDLYEELADACPVAFVKELLLTLQQEEAKHMNMIRHMLGRLEAGLEISSQEPPEMRRSGV